MTIDSRCVHEALALRRSDPMEQRQLIDGPVITTRHYKVVIVGGGAAGISVAARLARNLPAGAIGLVEPSRKHYYQPAWSLVGGGVYDKGVTERDEASVIPYGVDWIQDAVETFEPDLDLVILRGGGRLGYDALVVCPGLQLDWDKIEGLPGNVGRFGICSNYSYETVQDTWPTIHSTKSGNAVFTHPSTPVKCGGAPQKVMYLAESTFRRNGVRGAIDIHFVSGMAQSFTAPHYARRLDAVMERKGIAARYRHDLVAIRPERRTAVFASVDDPDHRHELTYALLHVTPPMSAPDFVKNSGLANGDGWIEVDKETLRHVRFPKIFALGDASGLPTSKTAAAIRKQAPVCADNLFAALEGRELEARYDGHTSCALITDYGRVILAEFGYERTPKESFPFDQSKERWSMYMLNKHLFPSLYWRGMLKGRF